MERSERQKKKGLHLCTRFTARLVRIKKYEELLDDTFGSEEFDYRDKFVGVIK